MTVLVNSFWLGIISSKHVYRNASANWMTLRFLFPRFLPVTWELQLLVAMVNSSLSVRSLIIWHALDLIICKGGTGECKLWVRAEEHRGGRRESRDTGKGEMPLSHIKQLSHFWCVWFSLLIMKTSTSLGEPLPALPPCRGWSSPEACPQCRYYTRPSAISGYCCCHKSKNAPCLCPMSGRWPGEEKYSEYNETMVKLIYGIIIAAKSQTAVKECRLKGIGRHFG